MPIRVGNISRDSSTPLYQQVAGQLRSLITGGELAAGEHLPNEIALAETFSLSRPTMRQALDELVRDGLITRRRGVGTVVTPHHFRRSAQLTSVYEDLLSAGLSPTTTTLSVAVEDGPHDVAATYGLGPDDRVVALERLRSADGVPLVLMRNWLPIRYAFLVSRQVDSLYQAMRERGDVPATAAQVDHRAAPPHDGRPRCSASAAAARSCASGTSAMPPTVVSSMSATTSTAPTNTQWKSSSADGRRRRDG